MNVLILLSLKLELDRHTDIHQQHHHQSIILYIINNLLSAHTDLFQFTDIVLYALLMMGDSRFLQIVKVRDGDDAIEIICEKLNCKNVAPQFTRMMMSATVKVLSSP